MARPEGTARLDDIATRQKFLSVIAKGKGRQTAAHEIGISSTTLRRYIANNRDFEEDLLDAEEKAYEPVGSKLLDQAKAGDVASAKEVRTYLRQREAKANRQLQHNVNVSVEVGASTQELIEKIQKLERTWEERSRLEAATLDRDTTVSPMGSASETKHALVRHPSKAQVMKIVDAEIL